MKKIATKRKKRKEKIGIDKLTICFNTNDFIFNRIKDEAQQLWWGEDGSPDFFTYRVDEDSDNRTQLISIIIPDEGRNLLLGSLRLYHSEDKKNANRAFFSIDNKALYNEYLFSLIGFVSGCMSLKFNNITKLDIALTSTYNYITAILKSVRNYNNLDMIYNGRKIIDPNETLQSFTEQAGETRKKKLNNPTLYFGHRKNTGLHVKVYDKGRELREQSQDKRESLFNWLGFKSEKLFRIEISFTNPEVRELCSMTEQYLKEWEHGENLINLINMPQFMSLAFCTSLSRVLHFKQSRKLIEIWEL